MRVEPTATVGVLFGNTLSVLRVLLVSTSGYYHCPVLSSVVASAPWIEELSTEQ